MTGERTRHMRDIAGSDLPARSMLAASWRRCFEIHALDPDHPAPRRRYGEGRLTAFRVRSGRLADGIQGKLDDMHGQMGLRSACLIFADAEGVALHCSAGSRDATALHDLGLESGVDWSEARCGTNGIGTCAIEARPLAVLADQHFHQPSIQMSCLVAPVFDHQAELAGVLNLSLLGPVPDGPWTALLFRAICDAALTMEADHFQAHYSDARILSVPGPGRGTALLAVDDNDVVRGASRTARRRLGIDSADIAAGICARDLAPLGPAGEEDSLAAAERQVLRRSLLRHGGNVSASARSLGLSLATMKRKIARHGLRKLD